MKKLKSSLLNMTLVMTIVAAITGGLLAFVNHATEPSIKKQQEKNISDGIVSVMADEKTVVAKTDTATVNSDGKQQTFILHHTTDADGNESGVAIESETQAFGGKLRILVGFNTKGDILGYTILETSETPGLGAKADTWFQKDGKGCIVGKNPASTRMGVTKGNEGDIDAITASTITSRAFLKAVQQAYEMIKQK